MLVEGHREGSEAGQTLGSLFSAPLTSLILQRAQKAPPKDALPQPEQW